MKRSVQILIVFFIGIYTVNCQGFWSQKSNVVTGTAGYASSTSFSIGNKGYVCCGILTTEVNILIEFNPSTNTWAQKNNFPGIARRDPHSFTIGNKAYVGLGHKYDGNYTYYTDIYEYDPATNNWTQKASFPGNGRRQAFSFSIDGKGYFGGGSDGAGLLNDLWQYDPVTNSWTQKTNLPFTLTSGVAFIIGDHAYAGVGSNAGAIYTKDFWQYNHSNDSWTQKANFGGDARFEATAFSMYNYGYIGTGNNATTFFNDFWQYDPDANSWTQIAVLPGLSRREAISFSINNKGYVGTGYDGSTWVYLKDLWEFTPSWFGIENTSKEAKLIEIYPNPVINMLTIDGITNNSTCSLFDLNGKLVFTKQIISPELDISSLTKGLYYLKLTSKEGIVVKKFIKD